MLQEYHLRQLPILATARMADKPAANRKSAVRPAGSLDVVFFRR
jgi:hypothetical protein